MMRRPGFGLEGIRTCKFAMAAEEEISSLENIGTWGLELEEKTMATHDKIQVSINEGSMLGTRRL
jgi:hypothetical protein